jgi:hypothetical protein
MKTTGMYAVGWAILLAALPVAPQGTQAARPHPARRIFELSASGVENTYRSDSGSRFQYGTPPIQGGFGASFGMASNRRPFGAFEGAGVHETIRVSHPPGAVVAAAGQFVNPPLNLGKTSLRLQNGWGLGAGFYPVRNLLLGARYQHDSWRWDWLGNPARTVLPYLKGTMFSCVGFARYDAEFRHLQLRIDGGAGRAKVDFSQGIEEYLGDGRETLLARLPSGTFAPFSGRLGYLWRFSADRNSGTALIPYARYDYAEARLSGTGVLKRQIVFGVELACCTK